MYFKLWNISQVELKIALRQVMFIRDTTRVGQEYRNSLSVAVACIEKYMEEIDGKRRKD